MVDTSTAPRALKERLPRAWPAFFERHGSFTAAQLAAMPLLLNGENVLLGAPTASGKTEAVVAPLVERHLQPGHPRSGVAVLYLAPTRALVNGLLARLTAPLETLGIRVAVKTGDTNTVRGRQPADLLLTTPESFDSLLAAQARLFAGFLMRAAQSLRQCGVMRARKSPGGSCWSSILLRVMACRGAY